jgi:protein-disulfide isomerase
MNDPRIAELLKQDAKDLATLKVNKTPSFFINGKPLTEFGQNQLRVQVENEIRIAYQ